MAHVKAIPVLDQTRRWPAWSRRSAVDRGQLLLLTSLAALTAVAWALTVHQARTTDMGMGIVARGGGAPPVPSAVRTESPAMEGMAMDGMVMDEPVRSDAGTVAASGMSGMGRDGLSWDGGATFVAAWAVMMAAMMFPSAAPMLLLFRTVSGKRRERGQAFVRTWVFAAGYLLVWTAVGGATWILVQVGGAVAGRLSSASREAWAPIALGATLLIAGLYQFSPLKSVCLRQCQSPMGFLMTRWRDGTMGAIGMGAVHGAYCLGCCWAIFAVLVAAGVMSLAWMLLLTLAIFAEKVLPLGRRAPRVIGTAFLALGILVAVGTMQMPWSA